MVKLTAKQESFIKLMTESDELARNGFAMLLKRQDFVDFFEALQEAGLFAAHHNPAPVQAETEGHVLIPHWAAVDYLVAVARYSGEINDLTLATKVMNVVRDVSESQEREKNGTRQNNYRTFWKFAEILGLVPSTTVSMRDIRYVETWLNNKIDTMMIAHALDEGAIQQFLSSTSEEDWLKAAELLRFCTAIYWPPENTSKDQKANTIVDNYWLALLIRHHAKLFGAKVGNAAAQVLLTRVREVFDSANQKTLSYIYRPAIEDHYQNHRFREAENITVEGLRDVLLSWCDANPEDARQFVKKMLADELEIVSRIGIYLVAQKWTNLRSLLPTYLHTLTISSGILHELYNLLDTHFEDFDSNEKHATLEAIRKIPLPTWSDDPALSLKVIQRRWLSAIENKGFPEADQWFEALQKDSTLGPLSEHPDFNSYIQSSFGMASSPYSIQELAGFAEAGVLFEKLDAFQETDRWNGSTLEGLISTFEQAVKAAPGIFLNLLPKFLKTTIPFQHSLIRGLKDAWKSSEEAKEKLDWHVGWETLITFFEQLLHDPNFGEEGHSRQKTHRSDPNWVAAVISEFLDAGSSNDDKRYPDELIPRVWELVKILLNTNSTDRLPESPMMQAMNHPKGQAVEALFSQSLRLCRASNKAGRSHDRVWADIIKPVFDGEILKCKDTNYEFSTLVGAFLPQMFYMNPEWAEANLDKIFPVAFPNNTICAVSGLAYAQFVRSVYQPLAERGILDRALRFELKESNVREQLLQRIAAAYLWGEESLDSPRFAYLFESGSIKDLAVITRVFSTARDDEQLSKEQKNRVVDFWERCINWSSTLSSTPAKLLASLSTLTPYLSNVEDREKKLLEAVAPYLHDDFNALNFFRSLLPLAEKNPAAVATVLGKAIERKVPHFDYEDRLKKLLETLVENGQKGEVILLADRLRDISGMQELFNKLTLIQA
jgi:hypothetical protein